ncbi:MAG: hypothetical protein QOE55_1186 [Acidobacteriaceae bacterium]|nr:hypothetical protein [Acidobacteriaceae bacterium]
MRKAWTEGRGQTGSSLKNYLLAYRGALCIKTGECPRLSTPFCIAFTIPVLTVSTGLVEHFAPPAEPLGQDQYSGPPGVLV